MFGWEFPPHNSGGLGVACEGLARNLSAQGAGIYFVLPRRQDEFSSSFCNLIFADVESGIEKLPVDSPITPYITSASYKALRDEEAGASHYGANLMAEVERYAQQAHNIASKRKFNVIHSHDWLSFPAGIEAKKVSEKPLVAHIHATEFDRTGGNSINQQVFDVERKGLEAADKVISVSDFTKKMLVDEYKIKSDKIETVHNGFDHTELDGEPEISFSKLKQGGRKIALFLGRLTLQKGPDYFLRAANRVLEYDPNVFFVIAGSGDMERGLIREAARLNIADKVLFTGFLRGSRLWQAYKNADLYVMPSVSEPFGISPLEALSRSTPVIISKQSGVSEVLSHAIKVDFWDVDKMADRILSILTYPELSQELEQNGGKELQKITWAEAAKKCMNIYNNLVQPQTISV